MTRKHKKERTCPPIQTTVNLLEEQEMHLRVLGESLRYLLVCHSKILWNISEKLDKLTSQHAFQERQSTALLMAVQRNGVHAVDTTHHDHLDG